MNYELAMMALEGLSKSRLAVTVTSGEVLIEADPAAFKELARLCLLLGGAATSDEAFELTPGTHLDGGSPPLRLRLRPA